MTSYRHKRTWIVAAALCLMLSGSLLMSATKYVEQIEKDTDWLSSYSSRIPGNVSHQQASAELEKKVRSIPNTKVWVQEFPIISPICDKAEMVIPTGPKKGTHKIYPVWPDIVRLKNTPKSGLSGKLILCGDGELEDLPAKSLQGQIAVIEMSRYRNWKRPFEFGAKAMLLLGSPADEAGFPEEVPMYRPRYYVPEGPLADAIRKGQVSQVTLHCQAHWADTKARNILALLKGTESAENADPIVLVAPYDSMSIIMDLAPGADNAVDAAFLLNTLRHFAQAPPKRSVLFAFIDAAATNHLGMRHFLTMLSSGKADQTRMKYMEMEQETLDDYEEYVKAFEGMSDEEVMKNLHDKRKYKELQRYCKDVISPEVTHLKEAAGRLRLARHSAASKEEKDIIDSKLAKSEARMEHLNKALYRLLTKNEITPDVREEAERIWQQAKQRSLKQLTMQRQRIQDFSRYDQIRNEIKQALDYHESETNPFRFLLAIDISDSSTTIGPALRCEQWRSGEKNMSMDFTRWLKLRLKSKDELLTGLDRKRLAEIGILPDSAETLLSRILNLEALEAPQLARNLVKEFPEIEEDQALDVAKALKDSGHFNKKKLMQVLKQKLPELNRSQMNRLSDRILNQQAIEGDQVPESFAAEPMALLSANCRYFGMKGVTWATLEGMRPRIDTPQDRADRLNWSRILPQIRVTSLLLEILLNDTTYKEDLLTVAGYANWRMPHGAVITETISETIPRTPNPDMLVVMLSNFHWFRSDHIRGIRGHEFVRSGADGTFRFAPYPASWDWSIRRKRLQAYDLDESGEICRGVSDSSSMIAGRVQTMVDLRYQPPLSPGRMLAFDCKPLDGPRMFDPRYQTALNSFTIYDVLRGGKPKRYSFRVYHGQIFGLLEPHARWQLVMRSGLRRNRMIFMNIDPALPTTPKMTPRQAMMEGYGLNHPFSQLPQLMSVKDFQTIDRYRLNQLAKAGVTFPMLEQLHKRTGELIQDCEKAYAADNGKELYSSANAALTNELRVYQTIREQSDDVVRGAIFLLILLVPFAIAMERLLFAAVRIGSQIGLSILLFLIMGGILFSFHPGFRISAQPIVILMAFIILILSTVVIIMLLRKFKAGLEEIQRGAKAEASGAQTSRGGVISSAIWLGIANMRKRLLRTFLTALTIVIITFALLCFTSSSTYQDKRVFTLDQVPKPEYSGALVQHPALRRINGSVEDNIRNLLGYKYEVVGRYWLAQTNSQWRLHVRNPKNNKMVPLKAALALQDAEKHFSHPQDVLEDWDQFAKGKNCYISKGTAAALQAKKGDNILMAGIPFRVLGIYDSKKLEKNLRKLDGQSLLPLDYTVETDDGQLNQENLEQEMVDSEIMEPDPNMTFVSGDGMIIVPSEYVMKLDPYLNSVAVQVPPGEIKNVADRLMKSLVYPIYYNDGGKVKAIVATPLIPKAPRKLFIPLLIAVLIIFNTMLNSVAERKKEIHVYTSLGLAPIHVGMLFLAEAATYGLMGSVFGYIVGQGLATILTHFELMGGIVLNYSGTNVILTMGLVLAVVLLSAMVPAFMASKVANPSKEGEWKVPEPKDGIINDLLPFTVTTHAAKGLICFVYEFMDAHTDGAIGEFTSDNLRYHENEDDAIVGLSGTVWLAPYDLGVRQDFKIEIVHDIESICNIRITLTHRAGQTRSWWRLNRVFLSELRRQFLGWRSIKPERALAYIEQGNTEFSQFQTES